MTRIHLCTGLLRRADDVLLVRCTYEGEPEPLWVLPGGRQERDETIVDALVREFKEETSLAVTPGPLAYVSESVDRRRGLHVVNCTFHMREVDPAATPRSADPRVVDVRFTPPAQALELLAADVLRIPVGAALGAEPHPRYFSFDDHEVAVPFFGRSRASSGAQ